MQRLELGLSRQQLASDAGCSMSYLALIEGGFTPRESDVLPRLERALNEVEPGRQNPSSTETSTAGQGRHEQVYR